MKKLLFQTSLFLLLTAMSLLLYFFIVDFSENSTDSNGVYIFGDSQTYQGIEANVLHEELKVPVYTAARHGAGVYDFLVFTKYVPVNTKVIVGFSKSMLLREKEKDFNQLGLSTSGLIDLKNNGYSFGEIREIFNNNVLPKKIFRTSHTLYPNSKSAPDSLIEKIIKSYHQLFSEESPYLKDKSALLDIAFKNLRDKNCTVLMIGFPYHSALFELESSSPIGNALNQFENNCIDKYMDSNVDTLWLSNSIQNMYDMTHLNTQAAKNVSEAIIKNGFEKNTFISINGGVAE